MPVGASRTARVFFITTIFVLSSRTVFGLSKQKQSGKGYLRKLGHRVGAAMFLTRRRMQRSQNMTNCENDKTNMPPLNGITGTCDLPAAQSIRKFGTLVKQRRQRG